MADVSTGLAPEGIRRGEAAADALRGTLWNAALDPRPFALVECRSVADVQQAIRFAVAEGRGVSVFGGGHDWAGRAAGDGDVVLDLRPLSSIVVDEAARRVTIGGGTRTIDLVKALPEHLAAVTCTVSSVGIVGSALGGGYGKLTSRFGLVLDNILRADLVLADGSVVVADAEREPDLFWALRGGGGNFGVVTAMTLALHPISRVLSAQIFIPLDHAKAGLLALQRVFDEQLDDLGIFSALLSDPAGSRGLLVAPIWTGDAASGERQIDRLAAFTGARVMARGWSSYAETFDPAADAAWPHGRCYRLDARNVLRIDDDVAALLVHQARAFPSAATSIVLDDFHGAPTRVPAAATAFGLRRSHLDMEAIAAWSPGEDAAPHHAWLEETSQRLAAYATAGGYPNLLAPGERDLLHQFYGAGVQRLQAVKRRFDPDDVFRSNIGRV